MEERKGKVLTQEQRDQIMTWLRAGYTPYKICGLAKNQGWSVSWQVIHSIYVPKFQKEIDKGIIAKSENKSSWFNKEFRAERCAEIAELLYNDIMEGKMYAEEVTERQERGGTSVTTKPVYFAGMIKNYKDMVDTIGNELGQRKQAVDVNFNKNQNLNLSVLVDRIYQQEDQVNKQLEGADIIDLPPGDDFADDKGFLAVVDNQTPEEIKELTDGISESETDVLG